MLLHHQLDNRGAMVVAHEECALNLERIHQPNYHVDLVRKTIVIVKPHDGVTESQEIGNDDAIMASQYRDDPAVFVALKGTAMKQNNRLAISLIDISNSPGTNGQELLCP
jgi:hypothetical protein